ncbi:MAG: TatD family hydrolase [Planctomycetes bacterium]|nr:TatD family hydrolase [Planctomycetota bacterium]
MLIDTHAHLDDDRFRDDLPAVLDRATAAGVSRILTIGVDADTSAAAVRLTEQYPVLAAVVGIQPNHVAEMKPGDWERVLEMVQNPRVVAVGETGLDRYWDRAPFPLQEEFFDRHLQLARERNLPVVIHCREAEADVVRMLRAAFERHGPIAAVMHSFCGDSATAQACLAMGLHISFAGMLTFKNNDSLRQVAATIPLDRVLVETDSPYLTPMPFRGKRNEPAYVAHTAACLAGVFGISVEALAEKTTENARLLFKVI